MPEPITAATSKPLPRHLAARQISHVATRDRRRLLRRKDRSGRRSFQPFLVRPISIYQSNLTLSVFFMYYSDMENRHE